MIAHFGEVVSVVERAEHRDEVTHIIAELGEVIMKIQILTRALLMVRVHHVRICADVTSVLFTVIHPEEPIPEFAFQ